MTRQDKYKSFKRRCKRMGFYERDFEEMALVIPEDMDTKGERISLKEEYNTDEHNFYEITGFKGKFVCLTNVDTEQELLVKPQVALRGIFSYYVLNRDDILMTNKEIDQKIADLQMRLEKL